MCIYHAHELVMRPTLACALRTLSQHRVCVSRPTSIYKHTNTRTPSATNADDDVHPRRAGGLT